VLLADRIIHDRLPGFLERSGIDFAAARRTGDHVVLKLGSGAECLGLVAVFVKGVSRDREGGDEFVGRRGADDLRTEHSLPIGDCARTL
jgi:hypothetical protein